MTAIENGFTSQFTNSVTNRPRGRRPTLRIDPKSTFIIIGVIISQMRIAIGTLIWLPRAELEASQRPHQPRHGQPEHDADDHAESDPDTQVAFEDIQPLG